MKRTFLALVLLFLPLSAYGAIESINLVPIMTSNTTPSGVVSASGQAFGYDAYKVFDGSNTSENNAWVSSPANPNFLQYDFGAGSSGTVSLYCLTSRNSNPVNPPKAWTFQGSNDGTSWATLDTESGQFSARVGNVRACYSVASPGTYRYYRWEFTDFFYFYSVDLGEIQLYYTYPYYYFDYSFLQSVAYVGLDVFLFVVLFAPAFVFVAFVLGLFFRRID